MSPGQMPPSGCSAEEQLPEGRGGGKRKCCPSTSEPEKVHASSWFKIKELLNLFVISKSWKPNSLDSVNTKIYTRQLIRFQATHENIQAFCTYYLHSPNSLFRYQSVATPQLFLVHWQKHTSVKEVFFGKNKKNPTISEKTGIWKSKMGKCYEQIQQKNELFLLYTWRISESSCNIGKPVLLDSLKLAFPSTVFSLFFSPILGIGTLGRKHHQSIVMGKLMRLQLMCTFLLSSNCRNHKKLKIHKGMFPNPCIENVLSIRTAYSQDTSYNTNSKWYSPNYSAFTYYIPMHRSDNHYPHNKTTHRTLSTRCWSFISRILKLWSLGLTE